MDILSVLKKINKNSYVIEERREQKEIERGGGGRQGGERGREGDGHSTECIRLPNVDSLSPPNLFLEETKGKKERKKIEKEREGEACGGGEEEGTYNRINTVIFGPNPTLILCGLQTLFLHGKYHACTHTCLPS